LLDVRRKQRMIVTPVKNGMTAGVNRKPCTVRTWRPLSGSALPLACLAVGPCCYALAGDTHSVLNATITTHRFNQTFRHAVAAYRVVSSSRPCVTR
jgi:hypothetical protein